MAAKGARDVVKTPQFRTLLIRKMNNLEPDYVIEFVDSERGLAFRMKDSNGRHRSKIINIYTDNGDALTEDNLRRLLHNAHFAEKLQ